MRSDPTPDVVREELENLRADWGEFAVRELRERIPAEEHDPAALPGDGCYRYASAWLRRDGEVLLVQPSQEEGWVPPGGTHEPGESFAETARRETREEAGVAVELVDVVKARVTLHEVEGVDRPPIPALGVVFDARYRGGDPRPEPGEIDDVRWFSEIPDADELVFEDTADYPL